MSTIKLFGGIIQLTGCTAQDIVLAITQFYYKHRLDLQRMVIVNKKSTWLRGGTGFGSSLKLWVSQWITMWQRCV